MGWGVSRCSVKAPFGPHNAEVGGSSPPIATIKSKPYKRHLLFLFEYVQTGPHMGPFLTVRFKPLLESSVYTSGVYTRLPSWPGGTESSHHAPGNSHGHALFGRDCRGPLEEAGVGLGGCSAVIGSASGLSVTSMETSRPLCTQKATVVGGSLAQTSDILPASPLLPLRAFPNDYRRLGRSNPAAITLKPC